jgi:hypothetical protein
MQKFRSAVVNTQEKDCKNNPASHMYIQTLPPSPFNHLHSEGTTTRDPLPGNVPALPIEASSRQAKRIEVQWQDWKCNAAAARQNWKQYPHGRRQESRIQLCTSSKNFRAPRNLLLQRISPHVCTRRLRALPHPRSPLIDSWPTSSSIASPRR